MNFKRVFTIKRESFVDLSDEQKASLVLQVVSQLYKRFEKSKYGLVETIPLITNSINPETGDIELILEAK